MNGLKKLLDSYKGMAFLIVIVSLTLLVALGKADVDHFLGFVKWGFAALAGARAYEEGAKAKATQ